MIIPLFKLIEYMKLLNWFRKTEKEVKKDAEDVFDEVKENIELVMGVLGSVLLSALLSIIRINDIVEVSRWVLFSMVIELIIPPFIMLFVFKLVGEKRDKRFKVLREANNNCIDSLRTALKEKEEVIHSSKLELQEKCNSHKLELARIEYEKDMEIIALKTKIETKDTKIELLESELNLKYSE